MFSRWRRRREIKRLQAICPHEWHITRRHRGLVGFLPSNYTEMYDVYCPICNYSVVNVAKWRADRVLREQEIRRKYFEGK